MRPSFLSSDPNGERDLPDVSGSVTYVTEYLSRWADAQGFPRDGELAAPAPSPLVPAWYRLSQRLRG